MTVFATITSPALPFIRDDLDADFIISFLPVVDAPGAPYTAAGRAALMLVGRNFGGGRRAGDAARAVRDLGVASVIGVSFAPEFRREAHALGLLTLEIDEWSASWLAEEAESGDAFTLDLRRHEIVTLRGARIPVSLPEELRAGFDRASDDDEEHFLVAAAS